MREKGTTHTSGTLESMSTSLLVERIESSLSPSHPPPPPPPPLLLSEVLLRLPLTAVAGRLMAREAGTTEREISLPAIPDRDREREPCMVSEVTRERSSFRGPYWSASCSRIACTAVWNLNCSWNRTVTVWLMILRASWMKWGSSSISW